MFESVRHYRKFFFDQETAYGGLHETVFDDRRRGSVRTVSRSESVVYVDIAEARELFAEFLVSSLFAGVEAKVLEKYALAVFQRRDFRLSVFSDDIRRKRDLTAEKFVQSLRNGSKREFLQIARFRLVEISLLCGCSLFFGQSFHRFFLFFIETESFRENIVRLTHVRAKNNLCAVIHQIFDRRQCAADTVFVRDDAVLHGHVEVASDEASLAGYVHVSDCLLIHSIISFDFSLRKTSRNCFRFPEKYSQAECRAAFRPAFPDEKHLSFRFYCILSSANCQIFIVKIWRNLPFRPVFVFLRNRHPFPDDVPPGPGLSFLYCDNF